MRKAIKIVVIVAAILAPTFAGVGCKSDSTNYMYIIRGRVKWKLVVGQDSLAPLFSAEDLRAYTFYADTTNWMVASFDDAKAGILTNRGDGTKKNYDFVASKNARGHMVMGPIKSNRVVVVVTYSYGDRAGDESDRPYKPYQANNIYAWREAKGAGGLEKIEMMLDFDPYRSSVDEYLDEKTRWIVKNQTPYIEP